ncbi:unnamed protein product [Discula destructiva]
MDFLADIKEKEVGAVQAPSFPQPKPAGFPEHTKRTRSSAFKQRRQGADGTSSDIRAQHATNSQQPFRAAQTHSAPPAAVSGATLEKRAIEEEVNSLLASMSAEEIDESRRELLETMKPSILEMLLKRSNIDDAQSSASVFDEPPETKPQMDTIQDAPALAVTDVPTPSSPKNASKPRKSVRFDEDAAPSEPPADLLEAGAQPPPRTPKTDDTTFAPNTTHFPQPKSLPDLDPADPDFLEILHEKYFPSLPADPSKLAWMAPLPTPHSTADRESPYYPGQDSLSLAALRFDFKGRLLAPARSRAIPVSQGLHHHGEAPEAAGYTIAELGRLARSAVPAQRCVAFQTLGRLLFRLGEGEWGGGEAEVAKGIWRSCQENRIIDSLLEAAEVPEGSGHRGSRAYATEAVWLFEKGGWREKFQGR